MNPFVYFVCVLWALVSARTLEVFDEQRKVGPVIRHNQESWDSRYGLLVVIENNKMLKAFDGQLKELKSMFLQQGKILAQFAKDQQKLIKERDKNRKRQKYVKKYLRKIYLGCKCKAHWLDPRNFQSGEIAGTKYNVTLDYSGHGRNGAIKVADVVNSTGQNYVLPNAQSNPYKTTTGVARVGQDADDVTARQTTPTLTILDRHVVHVDRFVAESAAGKGASIPVFMRKPKKYEKRIGHPENPENGILRDESKVDDVTEMTTVGLDYFLTEIVALPTGTGRKWPELARHVMGPYKGEYDVQVDLALGRVSGSHSSIKILEPPLRGLASYCIQQGVVKLAFGKPGTAHRHDAVLIDMTFDTPTDWVFNIGDSPSNDGRSGDGTTQVNDSEIDGFGTTFSVYGSDKSQDPWKKRLYGKDEFIKQRLSVVIADQLVVWNNFAGNFDFMRDPTLFALRGQSDDQGSVNYDIYLGLNRVIGGTYRNGRGLCTVAVKWL